MIVGFILILIVLIPFCIYLYMTNKVLAKKVEILEKEKRDILERKIMNTYEKDIRPIKNISTNIKPISNPRYNINTNYNKEEKPVNQPIIKEDNFNTKNYYQDKNNKEKEYKGNYLQELSKELNNKLEKEPIKLTAYEQREEDNAIISYQELKKQNKDKIIYLNEADDVNIFIENLKEFRNNLDKQ